MSELRLGDVIDDHCIKCRRITNHSIVSMLDGKAAKVRCRTCYHDHDFRNEQPPPSKKDLKKAELFKEVLAAAGSGAVAEDIVGAAETPATQDAPAAEPAPVAEAPAAPAKKKGRTKRA